MIGPENVQDAQHYRGAEDDSQLGTRANRVNMRDDQVADRRRIAELCRAQVGDDHGNAGPERGGGRQSVVDAAR